MDASSGQPTLQKDEGAGEIVGSVEGNALPDGNMDGDVGPPDGKSDTPIEGDGEGLWVNVTNSDGLADRETLGGNVVSDVFDGLSEGDSLKGRDWDGDSEEFVATLGSGVKLETADGTIVLGASVSGTADVGASVSVELVAGAIDVDGFVIVGDDDGRFVSGAFVAGATDVGASVSGAIVNGARDVGVTVSGAEKLGASVLSSFCLATFMEGPVEITKFVTLEGNNSELVC